MASSDLSLAGGSVTGKVFLPSSASCSSGYTPLLVAVHGGTYKSTYFDASSQHTIKSLVQAFGIPVVAIDRPGYGRTPSLNPIPDDSSPIQEHGRWLHKFVLPELWKKFSNSAKSIVLYGHSIGGATCCVAAGLHASDGGSYPLSAVIITGIGVEVGSRKLHWESTSPGYIRIAEDFKDDIMLTRRELYDSDILKTTAQLNQDAPLDECIDIGTQWLSYWNKYAGVITIPVLYMGGAEDQMWNLSKENIEDFGKAFRSSKKVETVQIPCAPHNIELSHQSIVLWGRAGAFAIESTVEGALAKKK
ncbi:alpha/beta-hydrolase [Corynespora cassiicola Philippines]|uniref:Alpha/beta-hydrolase n=1 Tax=Corynespora cassiicola Philippines TaxID=1448308 RepID=A0A2T2NSD1_CORCC|nr:alpha/beta-hydrolase [Corynespora cassiicola Philippines]